jgi:PI31 proteasome regulator N-terminal
VDRLGGKAEIRGIGLGDEKIARLEIVAKDYISPAALPLRITISESGEEERSDLEAKLKDLFISVSRIQGMFAKFAHRLRIINDPNRSCFTF